jgi:hypothetical protein
MIYVGIDPGIHGGIAFLADRPHLKAMPESLEDFVEYISWASSNPCVFLIEEQHAFPGYRKEIHQQGEVQFEINKPIRGVNATWTFAQHYGEIRGALAGMGIKPNYILPREWMKALGIAPKLKTETQTQWKNRLKQKAMDLFPGIKITKAVSDALLIAEVCRRMHQEKILQIDWDDI